MNFGICCDLALAPLVIQAGFDYAEIPATSFALDGAFAPSRYRTAGVKASNQFFPASISLEGSEWLDYARLAVHRAAEIGIETMVIGSGRARQAPPGMSNEDREARFIDALIAISAVARTLGVQIAPESLNRQETNVGNSLAELAGRLKPLSIGYTADSYHVLAEWAFDRGAGTPPMQHWREEVPYSPTHVHIASADRTPPSPETLELRGFVRRLQELEYNGRVSIEAKLPGEPNPMLLQQVILALRATFAI